MATAKYEQKIVRTMDDFTTIEQSRMLLALGVPIDSANMYYNRAFTPFVFNKGIRFSTYNLVENIIPCWSVGRLITICRVCSTLHENVYSFSFYKDTEDNVECAIRVIECGIKMGHMDFSKWEEYDKSRS